MNSQIRKATIEDYYSIHRIMIEAQHHHVLLRPDIFKEVDIMFTKEQFKEMLENNIIFVGECQRQVVGVIIVNRCVAKGLTKKERKFLYIDSMAVDLKYRGLGIGTKLLNKVTETAKKENYECIELQVYQDNEKAKHLYEAFGFKPRAVKMELKVNNK